VENDGSEHNIVLTVGGECSNLLFSNFWLLQLQFNL